MFDWNDLKYLLAVSRHGSTLAAARSREVNQSTVQRRLAELERRIGRSLVERHTAGYRQCVLGPIAELARSWRILTRPELRRTPRVPALFDFVVDEIETLRPIITG